MVLEKEAYEDIIQGSRELARKTKKLIKPDTLFVYIDKSGRLMRIPYETALKEKGVKLPSKRHFVNFELTNLLSLDPKMTEKTSPVLVKEVKEWVKKEVGGKKVRNIVIVDEYAGSGMSLNLLKDAFKKATGKKTETVALSISNKKQTKPKPDHFTKKTGGIQLWAYEEINPVKDAKQKKEMTHGLFMSAEERASKNIPIPKGTAIIKSERAAKNEYLEYVRRVKEEFEKTRSKTLREKIKARFKKRRR